MPPQPFQETVLAEVLKVRPQPRRPPIRLARLSMWKRVVLNARQLRKSHVLQKGVSKAKANTNGHEDPTSNKREPAYQPQ